MRYSSFFRIILLATGIVLHPVSGSSAGDLDRYATEGETVIQRLRAEMMQEMMDAQSQGIAASINVCRHLAPEISATIEAETGWTVRRTALRVRNPDNVPNEEEAAILRSFEVRNLSGQAPQLMRTTRVLEKDGQEVFHMMQAMPVFDMCLACHGENIDAKTREAIRAVYPEDEAVGYSVGDLRGAFSLYKPVANFEAAPANAAKPSLASLGYEPTRDPAANGDAVAGASLFASACQNCHAPEDLAPFVFPDAGAEPPKDVCKFLETHGMTDKAQDCDILAYLKDAARFLEGRKD